MKFIRTQKAPQPAGHYSQAVVHDGWIYVSGQLPIHPSKGPVLGTVEEQLGQALENLKAILEEAGCGLADVVRVGIYVSDMSLWDRVNRTFARFFGDHRPARTVVPTLSLHHGFVIEIDAVAAIRGEVP